MTSDETSHNKFYAGPDLHNAAARSRLQLEAFGRARGMRNAASVVAGLTADRLRRRDAPHLEFIVARGESAGQDPLSVAYAGSGANREWCLSRVLANYEVTKRQTTTDREELRLAWINSSDAIDVRFTDGLPRTFWPEHDRNVVTMPAWIKQKVRLRDDWSAQVDSLRRATRQEIGRILRKYRYDCSLTKDFRDYRDFYENLYVPYVTQRFGPAAFVVDPTSFYQECRRGVLLRLTHEKRVVGAALLRPIGRTLAVVWSALDVLGDGGALRGVTDSLDYFSLLYAHMTGCRWLDLGPSRPDLCDGILRYKSKWGAEITQGLVPQANIMWACKQKPNGDLDYFRRHAFLTKTENGLQALMVIDGRSDLDVFLARLNTGLSSGIRNYRVIALQGIDARLKERTELLDANLALLDASDFPDFTSAFTSLA